MSWSDLDLEMQPNAMTVAEYRAKLTDAALQIVESATSSDPYGRASQILALEVRRLHAKVAVDASLVNGEAVRIPTSTLEAELMVRLGMQYLREHAPDRLASYTTAGGA